MNISEKIKAVAEKYLNCKNDGERLQVLKDNNKLIKAVLDNDCTWVELICPNELSEDDFEAIVDNYDLPNFDYYHYWSDGCIKLFEFAGITAEAC